jgi:hypothetical protein
VPTIAQVRVLWSGTLGLPGVNTIYVATGSSAELAALKTFYDVVAANAPTGVTIQVPGSGETVDVATGLVNGTWSGTKPAASAGSQATGFAAAVGGCVNWLTGIYVGGRQLRGKTFLVPLGSAVFDTGGNIKSANLTSLQNAAIALAASVGQPIVYSRKTRTTAISTSAVINARGAVLRSRRD